MSEIIDSDGQEVGFTLDERAEYCATTVIEHGGPRSLGGAMEFLHHASRIRQDPDGVAALRKHGLNQGDIDYVLNFTIKA